MARHDSHQGRGKLPPCMPQSECGAGHTGYRAPLDSSPGGSQDIDGVFRSRVQRPGVRGCSHEQRSKTSIPQRTDLAQVKRDRHTGRPRKAHSTKAFRLRQSISSAEMRRKQPSLPTGEVRPSEHDYDYKDYILALYLARYAGLRIHECFRMDTAAAERALRENAPTVKGKGGKIRIVPIEDDRITMILQRLLEETERGHKLLVPDGVPTDRAINGMQQFIIRHRDAICDPAAPDRRITFHGLRHTYAAEKYTSLVNGGMTPLDAHFTVSRLLEHERPDVTDIYLASVKGGTARGE